jgi:hypothetical protein
MLNDLTFVSVKRSLLGKPGSALLTIGCHVLGDQRWMIAEAAFTICSHRLATSANLLLIVVPLRIFDY